MDASFSPPSILLADDDQVNRDIMSRFFAKAGWKFDLVCDSGSALDAATKRAYDVVIADFNLADVNSVELLKNIRKNNPDQAVIVVTATDSVEDAVELMKAGAVDLMQKPVDFDFLERAVNRIVLSMRQEYFVRRMYRFVRHESTCLEFTSAQLANVRIPLRIVDGLYQSGQIDQSTKLKLELAFQEAITNSIDHGNLELESAWKEKINGEGIDKYSQVRRERMLDPEYANRKVTIIFEYDGKKLTINLKDQGKGFAVKRRRLKMAAMPKCHGRGLMIINGTMDKVKYSNRGRQLTMVKIINRS